MDLKKAKLRSRIVKLCFAVIVVVLLIIAAASGKDFNTTIWALLPPVVAIGLALATKEVYSSLFIGILIGGLLYSGFGFEGTLVHVFEDGFVASVADSYNVGILIFLVILGAIVALMNKAGGSEAFGIWASEHIKTKTGAMLATTALGVLIFIDDYFNCLTVGSVMRPVADKHGISKEKLSYLIDATAAPICIIAPVSSWAAAVAGFVKDSGVSGFGLFVKAIPYNFYAILTIVMMLCLAFMKFDYGPMRKFEPATEENAKQKIEDYISRKGEFSEKIKVMKEETVKDKSRKNGKVIDLVFPIVVLIISCVIGMLYSGEFFSGAGVIEAFSNSDASVGLMLGSACTFIITIIYFLIRNVLKFQDIMSCLPEGFKAMVPAILILVFAWTLKAMTDSLGAKEFVEGLVYNSAAGFKVMLPAIIFLIGCFLSFSTGTSWGTFGILIPITISVFPITTPIGVVCVSACMAGAVCGDHCSPISDTTIMASAGADCDHINHVNTQLPYAITVAAVSFVSYIIAGLVPNWLIVLPIAIVLMIGTLFAIKKITAPKAA
ncbi:MAG: Na+/H+ antiporter NhaC family protein [Sphaerochaetaceae bacterium]|nr:Na+/H+ antiporter NhaC family protein [Sphaerochaetaceae bacterium]